MTLAALKWKVPQLRHLASAVSALGAAGAPLDQLQGTFDEVLLRPWRFPPHVQRLHGRAEAERQQRQDLVDQSAIGAQRQSLFARKVVYAIVGRESPHIQVCVTKYSCAQDFFERSVQELQRTARSHGSRNTSSGRRKNAAKSGLALQNPEGLLLYVLESLDSGDIPYHRICDLRLRHWAQLVRDLSGE